MLAAADRIALPDGVRVDGGRLVDDVREGGWPLNGSGAFVVERAGRPLGEVAAELAAVHGIPPRRACDDVLAFAWALNRALLANLVPGEGRAARWRSRVALALRLLPAGRLPSAQSRRVALDTCSGVRAAVTCVRALAGRAAALTAAGAAGALQLAGVGGPGAGLALGVAAGSGAGLLLHEAGHAAALRGLPAALVVSGLRTFVLHRPLGRRRRMVVAAAGPAVPVLAGVALSCAALALAVPVAAAAGAALCAHALGLTLATADGRNACGC